MYKIDILDEVLIERVNKAILANVEKAKLFKFESGQKFNSFILYGNCFGAWRFIYIFNARIKRPRARYLRVY